MYSGAKKVAPGKPVGATKSNNTKPRSTAKTLHEELMEVKRKESPKVSQTTPENDLSNQERNVNSEDLTEVVAMEPSMGDTPRGDEFVTKMSSLASPMLVRSSPRPSLGGGVLNAARDINAIILEIKDAIESKAAGNLKREVRQDIIDKLHDILVIVLGVVESKSRIEVELERARTTATRDLEMVRSRHNKQLEQHISRYTEVDSTIKTLGKEMKDTRAIIAELSSGSMEMKKAAAEVHEATLEAKIWVKNVEGLAETLAETQKEIQKVKTYAEALSTGVSPLPLREVKRTETATAPAHTVIITSTDKHDTSDVIVTKIRNAIDARTNGVRVDRVRKARDQKVIISCEKKEDIRKVSEKIKNAHTNLKVEEAVNKDPLIIMYNVMAYNTDEDIIISLKQQNRHILGEVPDEDIRMKVKYRKKTRNHLVNHVVMQVSPAVWQRLTAKGKVHIDLQRVTVKDQTPLVQCLRCLKYGHGRKLCTETVDLCSHCGGPHLRETCPERLAGEPPKCYNCFTAEMEKTDHNSFDECCPVRKKWDALSRSRVAYC